MAKNMHGTKKPIEAFRDEFFLNPATHVPLNNAGISLLPKKTVAFLDEFSHTLAKDGAFLEPALKLLAEAKTKLAQILNADESDLVWTQNCSASISIIAAGLKHKKNEEIIICENDYPANFYPWVQRAKRNNSKLHIVKARSDLSRPPEDIIAKINSNTRIVALSLAQSDCGYLMDISGVAQTCEKVGAILLLDVIQTVGICPTDFKNSGAHIFCGGTHKWLCGPLTIGFIAIKKEKLDEVEPILHGAENYGTPFDPALEDKNYVSDAKKFQQGTLAFHCALGAAKSIETLLDYGVENINKRAMEIRAQFENEFRERGFTIYGGASTAPHISVTHPKNPVTAFSEKLKAARISHALRPAPMIEGERVLRFSPHAYNTNDEVQKCLEVMADG